MRGMNETHPLRVIGGESRAESLCAWAGSSLAGVRKVIVDWSDGDSKFKFVLEVGGDYGKRERLIKVLEDWGCEVETYEL